MSGEVVAAATPPPQKVAAAPSGAWWMAALAALLVLPLTLSLGLNHGFSHDEGQHLAAGALLGGEGLLPYRDFAYFHVPYLVYLYGALFQCTDHYFFAARLVGAISGALICGAIAAAAWQLFAGKAAWQRAGAAAGGMLLLLGAPLFADSVGYCWNQEPSVLFALLAFLAHWGARDARHAGWRYLLSGGLLGLAIGFRITVAPLVLPFAILLWLEGKNTRAKIRALACFAAGLALALLPVLAAFLSAPREFLFGNVEFPKVNVAYRFASGEPRTMTLPKKLRFLFKEVMRPNGLLFFGFLAFWLATQWRSLVAQPRPRLFRSVLLLLPFLLMGALAPSPVFDQYFFPLLPFLVIGVLCLCAQMPRLWPAFALLAVAGAAWQLAQTEEFTQLFKPAKWTATRMQGNALALRQAVLAANPNAAGPGKILTLNPAIAVEARLPIYPALVTGPFAWRVADRVAPERRAGLHLLAPADLEAALASDPPAAILLGAEKRWEAPLTAFAKSHRYRRVDFPGSETLWLAPLRP